ncbi:MAG: DUF808 domain-containing protein [Coriobacteriia bacterium]|nr:DUF808 domain-containing protein [Coriobacteriia bacterium]
MALGLAALIDDVAAITKAASASLDDISSMAAKASGKAMSVVIDDAAVTPQYLEGSKPNRELPMVWKIAKGSLINKLIIIPVVLILSTILPQILNPLLMLGGAYLAFEGAEKVIEFLKNQHPDKEQPASDDKTGASENQVVKAAITTDFILSAEIIVISYSTIASNPMSEKIPAMILVALLITLMVYGSVAILIKIDDLGLKLMGSKSTGIQTFGRKLVLAMPRVMNVISVIGTLAMLWVGGHILLSGLSDFGISFPLELVHMIESGITSGLPAFTGAISWLVDSALSAIFGLIVGSIIALLAGLVLSHKSESLATFKTKQS